MTCEEFSNTFDTLLNSYSIQAGFSKENNNQASIALDEYEKSVFLTKAQKELILALYNGNNGSGNSFESTEENRRYLAPLVREITLKPMDIKKSFSDGSHDYFTLPEDLWFITYEAVDTDSSCDSFKRIDVYPVTQDDYNRTKRNPFRGANMRRALRLDLSDGVIEIVSKYNIGDYYIRYLKKPSPIILAPLPDDVSIDGEKDVSECKLHEALHERILDLAVREAIQSKITNNK